MSTLVAQTISNGTVSTSSANVIQGSAKAWARFSATGGTITINGSFNISSITRSSTGIYVINFTNVMPNANYSVTSPTAFVSASNYVVAVPFVSNGPSVTTAIPTTSSFTLATVTISSGAVFDPTYVNISVFSS
jgi:hypothetical protein